jgi:hypothetical protein
MTQEPFRASECEIGRDGNRIKCANDGSMVFSDRFVSGVRLVDLLNGSGGGGGKPSVTEEVLVTDWVFDHHDQVYDRDFWSVTIYYALIGFNIQVTDQTKVDVLARIILNESPLSIEYIEFDDLQIYEDRIKVVSSSKIHCLLNISTT